MRQMLTLKEASELFGMSYHYFSQLCKTGAIPFIRSGRKVFLSRDDVEDYFRKESQENMRRQQEGRDDG